MIIGRFTSVTDMVNNLSNPAQRDEFMPLAKRSNNQVPRDKLLRRICR